MLLGEPAPTQGDLHFRLLGIPVRVHPFFWVATAILGMGSGPVDPMVMLVWVGVVFFSILVHEMGHATMQVAYGGHPWITLYGLGGLASCSDCNRSPWRQIVISLAGPFAGFFLAAFIVSVLFTLGRFQGFVVDWIPVRWAWFDPQTFMETGRPSFRDTLVFDLLYVNIVWGLVNLLPVYPLDGGQISRELFTLVNPRAGIIQSLQLSAGVAVLLAAYAILNQRIYTAFLFGYLAYSSFQTLQAYRNHCR